MLGGEPVRSRARLCEHQRSLDVIETLGSLLQLLEALSIRRCNGPVTASEFEFEFGVICIVLGTTGATSDRRSLS